MKSRTRLSVEVIVYRIDETFNEETQDWDHQDADCMFEGDFAEGVIRETPDDEKLPLHMTEQTKEQYSLELDLDKAADAAYEWGRTYWAAKHPTGS